MKTLRLRILYNHIACIFSVFVLLPPEAATIDISAYFSKVPPSVIYVQTGKTATFGWEIKSSVYNNRDTQFGSYSPTWNYESASVSQTLMAYEWKRSIPPWKWTIAATCPARYLNPTRLSKQSTANLLISNVTLADDGTYQCTLDIRSLGFAVSSSARLIVTVSPQFQAPLPPLTAGIEEGQELNVLCTAIGPPTPNITWVRMVDHVTMSTGTGSATLRISNIRRDQNGTYQCQARNNPNERPVTAQTVVVIYYPAQSTVVSANVTVLQGDDIVLRCTADGNPPPSISWTKDDGVIKAGHTVAGGTLRIPDVIKTDAGKYICTANNTYDSNEHTHTAAATVVVKYQPSILLGDLNNQIKTFNESGILTIKCEADGHPTPTIKWKTPKGTVHTGKVLDIPSVNRSDAGDYMCIADNGIGSEVNASIQITIQYKPVIDEARSSGNSASWNGKSIQLRCTATGIPGPQVSWYKPTHQQILGGSEVTVLTTADQEDYGQYKCRATNILGSDEHIINVTQLCPVNITVTNIEASSVTVSWTKPDDNGGKPVLDYKIEINSSEASVKIVNTYAAIITKLKQNTRYQVTVSAENVVGYGNTSTKGFTTLKEGPPEVPELTATLDHTSGLCIWLTWTKPDDNGGEISKYTIYMKEDGDSEWSTVDDVSNQRVLQYNISTNIEYGKEYKVIVTAWNVHGESRKDDVLAKTIDIPDYKLSTTPSSGNEGDNTGANFKDTDGGKSNYLIALGIIGSLLMISLIFNMLMVWCWKKARMQANARETEKTKPTYQVRDDQTYDNAIELRNISSSPATESELRPTPLAALEYEAANLKNQQNPAKAVVYETPFTSSGASHYQELSPLSVAQDNTRSVYQSLQTGVPLDENEKNTYQALGQSQCSNYQSLFINTRDSVI